VVGLRVVRVFDREIRGSKFVNDAALSRIPRLDESSGDVFDVGIGHWLECVRKRVRMRRGRGRRTL
jgi:hypothetical protein